ncbi:MAG TPA: ABC transporter permease [Ktedonobacterales bacterium]|nr:ABC transporter permease [Ktedonobacterales bacterium]
MATLETVDTTLADQHDVLNEQPRPRMSRFTLPALPRSGAMRVGIGIIAFFWFLAIFGPLFVHGDPHRVNDNVPFAGPTAQHWLGTTNLGQDVLSQLIVGARPTVFIGFIAGIAVTILSVAIGMTGGYLGGWVDEIVSFLSNVFLTIPGLPLMLLIASLTVRGPVTIVALITFTGWAWGARVMRAQTLSLRQRDFVQAARVNGENIFRILFFEILPNLAPIVVASFIFTTIGAIMAEAGLEFLGFGDQSIISWGTMLYFVQNSGTLVEAWWWFLPPGLCIALLGTALALINYGLDSVVNPRLRAIPVEKTAKKAM